MRTYHREISPDRQDSLCVVASLVQPGDSVLDLGVGSGALGHYLSSQKISLVDGITLNPEEASLAAKSYRDVFVADLDTAQLSAFFRDRQYDCIVCADVFEHLKQPDKLLAQLPHFLKPGGRLISSVPNAAYTGLVTELMLGEFRYREEGLLDQTHLRFFTLKSLQRWLVQHGWQILETHRVYRPLGESEFRARIDTIAPAVARYLMAQPEGLVYQYVMVSSHVGSDEAMTHAADSPPELVGADFTAQLYWAEDGTYDEDHKVVARGQLGQDPQTLVFDLNTLRNHSISGLRLDPSDRTGHLRLHSLELVSHDTSVVWRWDAQNAHDLASSLGWTVHDALTQAPHPLSAGLHLLVYGPDPMLHLPIPPSAFPGLKTHGGYLRMQVGWPMSADYLALVPAIYQLKHSQQLAIQQTQTSLQQLNELNSQAHEQHAMMLSLQSEHHAMSAKLLSLRDELHAASNDRVRLRTRLKSLQQHLQWIEQSTVFRVTRPLVRIKMALEVFFRRPHPSQNGISTHTGLLNAYTPVPVDIVVPVYKGMEDTQRCLESLVNASYSMPVRLVVINDCSPEHELVMWLKSFAEQSHKPEVVLLHNTENLGFVGTVNRGMSYGQDRDVVLFNSDAEAAHNWLDRLQAAAYSSDNVATATPFSNNATICSYPRFCENSAMPIGETVASLDALCAAHLSRLVIDIPTAHGFCMYIRRAALDEVGLFDEVTFGKGYGEENDFCIRATQANWRHVHALDVFVRHAGGVSFGTAKNDHELRAIGILRQRHPHYEPMVQAYIQSDPAAWARLVIDLARMRRADRHVVLNITHNRDGGTLKHQEELAQSLHSCCSFLQLQPTQNGVALGLCGSHEGPPLHFSLPGETSALIELLKALNVCHIHFHHVLGHSDEILTLPALLGISYDFTAHDYYSFCPQISLTDVSDRYCGERGISQCEKCLDKLPAPGGLNIHQWHDRHRPLLEQARHVFCPTPGVASRIQRFAPLASVVTTPHLDLVGATLPSPRMPGDLDRRPLRIVVIGAMSKIKGADLLEQTALLAAQHKAPVEFHVLGYAYRALMKQPRAKLTVHGAYADRDLPALLAWLQPDIAWFPAQWPETYSYTLSACLQAGLPIAASKLGAFSDRLAHRPCTWLAPWDSTAKEWLDLLLDIRNQSVNAEPHSVSSGMENSRSLQASHTPIWSYTTLSLIHI